LRISPFTDILPPATGFLGFTKGLKRLGSIYLMERGGFNPLLCSEGLSHA
jgi:hypothetical protein